MPTLGLSNRRAKAKRLAQRSNRRGFAQKVAKGTKGAEVLDLHLWRQRLLSCLTLGLSNRRAKAKRLALRGNRREFEQKVAKGTKGTEALDLHWCAIAAFVMPDDFAV
jgi:hypothetical protein